VVFDAVKAATEKGIDALIVDTAGRLQNKRELMDELAKIRRVLGRLNPEAPHDVVLVLDATNGQNALQQIETFKEVAGRDRPDHDQARRHRARRRAGGCGRAIRPADPRHRRGRKDRRPAPVRSRTGRARDCGSGMMTEAVQTKPKSGWLNLLVDYGPMVVFFLTYRYYSPPADHEAVGEVSAVVISTLSFMVAACRAGVSKWKLGHISPMLWLSTVLIVGFGGLTIVLRDPIWIQVKPTAIYLLFAVVLLGGVCAERHAQVPARSGVRRAER
jgi:hypothetical protein